MNTNDHPTDFFDVFEIEAERVVLGDVLVIGDRLIAVDHIDYHGDLIRFAGLDAAGVPFDSAFQVGHILDRIDDRLDHLASSLSDDEAAEDMAEIARNIAANDLLLKEQPQCYDDEDCNSNAEWLVFANGEDAAVYCCTAHMHARFAWLVSFGGTASVYVERVS